MAAGDFSPLSKQQFIHVDNHFNVIAEVVMDGSLGSDGDVSGDDNGGGRHGHRREGDVGVGGRRGWVQIKTPWQYVTIRRHIKNEKNYFYYS